MSEWTSLPLSELVAGGRGISYGIVQPGSHQDDGIPILRVSDLRNGRLNVTQPVRVAKEMRAVHARTRPRGGELLLTLVGTVGEAAVVGPELARLRNLVRITLRRHKYPPEQQDEAIRLVLKQAERLAEGWAAS